MKREHICQVASFSIAVERMTEAALNGTVQHAVKWNAFHNATGTLMASAALFIQWLEGPKHRVRHLFERILQDCSHHCIVKRIEKELFTDRLFPEWFMQRSKRQEMPNTPVLGAACARIFWAAA